MRLSTMMSLLCTVALQSGQVQILPRQGKYDSVVYITVENEAKDPVFQNTKIFKDSSWVKELGNKCVAKDDEKGLLVVAELSAIESPRDQALEQLLALGAIDPSGTIIVAKDKPELAKTLSAIWPLGSADLIGSGTFRLSLKPSLSIGYGSAGRQAFYEPKGTSKKLDLKQNNVSTYNDKSLPDATIPSKIRDFRYLEFARRPSTGSRIFDAQVLLKDLVQANHDRLMDSLIANCAKAYGVDVDKLAKMGKNVKDLKDLPYDLKTALAGLSDNFMSGEGGELPSDGKISGIVPGLMIEVAFQDAQGRGEYRQGMGFNKQ